MTQAIDYYFYSASPFTYLGHKAITEVAARHGARLNYKPVNLMGLWEVSGAVPPAKRPPVRQRYRLVELARVADFRGLPINIKPAHFPVDATLADLTVAAIADPGGDPNGYMATLFSACWAEDKNLADEAVLRELLSAAGHDADGVIEHAKTDKIAAIRARNTEEAIAADAVGVPAFVLNGEVFWGQDRIEYIDQALTSGRGPFIVTAE
ncbi:2-hydroxychromene-2-carboxylate isomerase [Oricola cellulosilytica]|uniref:2-hydroxychromene-2-carboxylate isomerase n=1 Tax=Oricola cellulosilytica TaxID=1429082 RepID=A0A4R0PHM6_9HYPH|nr:2-hydroxychromene-2-carboxylate isomerase [Oricola cellulosilytica]TCD16518.1 2-hydroxychromene-2-carboxylate isomerase [Oricola cellulosilytica]